MGLVIDFSGWVQGNIYKDDDLTGQITFYVGSGFSVKGQYMILTWEINVSVGAGGQFEFSLKYNEEKSKYDQFVVDSFAVIFKTGLELYGGIGLSSIASAGIYGAGSITGKDQFYPDPVIRSLIVAGECGIKVKVFSRALFSFAVVSGSHEFVEDKENGSNGNHNALLNFDKLDRIEDYLLNVNGGYADTAGAIKEPGSEEIWMEGAKPRNADGLQVFDTDPDYDGIIARNIYPENRLQVLSTGTDDFPQVSVFFIRSDSTRENGNRARLAYFYYNEVSNYLSEPQWLFSADDGTADYNPCAYSSDYNGKTYLVWQNALKELDDTSTFQEIAENSDLYFSEYYPSYPWTEPARVTFYGDDAASKVFAAGARVSELRDGSPLISYYTNSVEDPVGVDSSASHDIYLAHQENGRWVQEKAFQVTGTVSDLETGYFHGDQSIAVSYTSQDAQGKKTYHIELRQKKGSSWYVVYSESGDEQNVVSTARFVQAGRGEKYLTWYEKGGLYRMTNDSLKPVRITPEDLDIPTSDYRLFGSFAKSNIALIGTESKDSSENAFAIVSNDAGKSWRKASVTDIDDNALVNEIGIAYTRSEEPIVFYSVQNYGVNTDMSYVSQDAETLAASPSRAKAGGLDNGFLLGKDDPRFTDTSTDLYMKARGANRKVEITDITFDDIEGAQRGEPTPMTVTVENTGLYRIDHVTLYAGDEKLGDFPVNLKGGEKSQLKASIVVPEDAGNDPIDYKIQVSSRKDIIDHEMTGTMDIGHITARFRHQLENGTESIAYRLSHTGFLPQKVVLYLFDEDTGEKFY
ncbi:MAG: hypothetical protein II627_02020, partial [Lachnospiraceae bacterium]|nr:hypothetical protein [Lachnospiraceae bacterium]